MQPLWAWFWCICRDPARACLQKYVAPIWLAAARAPAVPSAAQRFPLPGQQAEARSQPRVMGNAWTGILAEGEAQALPAGQSCRLGRAGACAICEYPPSRHCLRMTGGPPALGVHGTGQGWGGACGGDALLTSSHPFGCRCRCAPSGSLCWLWCGALYLLQVCCRCRFAAAGGP